LGFAQWVKLHKEELKMRKAIFVFFLVCQFLVIGTLSYGQDKGSLTVAVYGGEWGDAISKAMFKPFEAKFGVKIIPEPGVSTVTIAKLKQQKGNPLIDVAWLDGGVSELALDDDLLEMIDPKTIPNLRNVINEAIYKTKSGGIFSVGGGFYSFGVVYNTEKVKAKPTSWLDLWKPEFAGKVTIPSPATAMGVPFIILISQIKGGSIENVTPGFDLIKKLDVAAYFETSGAGTNMFQAGEVVIGAHYSAAAWYMADKNLPITLAIPKEGAPAGDIRMHIVKGSKNKALAEKFIDFAVTPEAQKALSEILYLAPVAKGTQLNPTAKERMPYGAEGSIKNLKFYDWQVLNAKRPEIVERWNKEIGRK
jgi:putative spermidine/putrescine transport system substrate-binding protein